MVFHENEETVFRYWINPITKEVTCQKGYHHHQKSVIKASHDAVKRKQFGTILLVNQQKFDNQTCIQYRDQQSASDISPGVIMERR